MERREDHLRIVKEVDSSIGAAPETETQCSAVLTAWQKMGRSIGTVEPVHDSCCEMDGVTCDHPAGKTSIVTSMYIFKNL